MVNNYISKWLVNDTCQLTQIDQETGLRLHAAGTPKSALYITELHNQIQNITEKGDFGKIYSQYD